MFSCFLDSVFMYIFIKFLHIFTVTCTFKDFSSDLIRFYARFILFVLFLYICRFTFFRGKIKVGYVIKVKYNKHLRPCRQHLYIAGMFYLGSSCSTAFKLTSSTFLAHDMPKHKKDSNHSNHQ